jgi:hypothetical protein
LSQARADENVNSAACSSFSFGTRSGIMPRKEQ